MPYRRTENVVRRLAEREQTILDAALTRGKERLDFLTHELRNRTTAAILAFQALKNLSMLGWYSQDASWASIGYQGPLIARRTVVS